MDDMVVAGGKARLSVSGAGFFHLRWVPDSQVDVDDARASIEAMRDLGGGTARPLLVEISGVSMSAAARAAFERARAVSAVALVGSSVVDTVVAAALRRHDFCPHAYFVSQVEAVEWLSGLSGLSLSGAEGGAAGEAGRLGGGYVVGAAHPHGHENT